MIRRRIDCIEREARPDRRSNAIKNPLAGSRLDAEELVELLDFRPDLSRGLRAISTSWQCLAVKST